MAIFAPLDRRSASRRLVQDLADRLLPRHRRQHWFGTDELGRDIFARIIYGSRITLFIVVLVAVIAAPDRPRRRHGRRAMSAAGSTRC